MSRLCSVHSSRNESFCTKHCQPEGHLGRMCKVVVCVLILPREASHRPHHSLLHTNQYEWHKAEQERSKERDGEKEHAHRLLCHFKPRSTATSAQPNGEECAGSANRFWKRIKKTGLLYSSVLVSFICKV